MNTTPAGIAEADWLATPAAVRAFILAQQQENDELRSQLTALASELASLRERIGRSLSRVNQVDVWRQSG